MHLVHNSSSGGQVVNLSDARSNLRPQTTWPMHAVARQLGVERRSEKWQRDYFAALIANEGFPAPLPTMVCGAITRDIFPRKSQWIAAAVQAWLDGTLPPGFNAAIDSAEEREAADRLDQRADNLFATS